MSGTLKVIVVVIINNLQRQLCNADLFSNSDSDIKTVVSNKSHYVHFFIFLLVAPNLLEIIKQSSENFQLKKFSKKLSYSITYEF